MPESGNEFLEDHVGQTGAAWETSVAEALVVSFLGVLYLNTDVALAAIGWPSGGAALSPDVTIDVLDARHGLGQLDTPVPDEAIAASVYFRWNRATDTGYRLRLQRVEGGVATVALFRVVAGVETLLDSVEITWNEGYGLLSVECAGATISVRNAEETLFEYEAPGVNDDEVAMGFGLSDSVAGLAYGHVLSVGGLRVVSAANRPTSAWSRA